MSMKDKKDIAQIISISEGIRQNVAERIIEEIFFYLKEEVSRHNKIWLRGVGFWWVRNFEPKKRYNVKKGRWYVWADRPSIVFRMSDSLRQKIQNRKGTK